MGGSESGGETTRSERFKIARLARLTLFKLLPSLGIGNLLLLGIMLVIGGILPVALSVASGMLVGSVPSAIEGGLGSPAGRVLISALAAVSVTYLIQQVIGPVQGTVSETMGRRLDGKLRERVMRAVLRPVGIEHLEDSKLLDEISKARGVGPGQFTPGGAVAGLAGIASRYLQGFLFAVLLAGFRWWLPAILLPIQLYIRRRGRREYLKMVEIYAGQTNDLRRSQYLFGLGTKPSSAKEARSFGLQDWIREQFSSAYLPVVERVWRQRAMSVWSLIPLGLVYWPFQLLAYVLMVQAAVRGEINVGQLTVFLIAVRGMAVTNQLSWEDLAVEFGMASVPAVLQLEETTAPSRLLHRSKDPSGLPGEGIRFENISFRYPGGSHDVYSGLDLFVPAGSSLAIVGPNGAGKTTLIKLLCRLYDPTEGRITVDGTDLRDFEPRAWQMRVAAIFQDFVRYELSARDNVGLGALRFASEDHLLEAARKSGAEAIVQKLSKGWDTILSRRYTDGADLSGGEWQKVALARALLAASARPGILVLDEPTANLDVRAEAEIYERFLELTRGLTTLLISHRFSTVRGASRICVIDGGRVIEQGTHDELMAHRGKYAQMFNLQAARFVPEASGATDD